MGFGTLLCTVGFQCRREGKECSAERTQSAPADFLADKTVEFIKAHRDRPFCFMVSFPDPHGPNTVRRPYETMFDPRAFKPPRTFHKPAEGLPSWGKKQVANFSGKVMAGYFGMVKCIDDNVGKILKALKALGLLERTAIVFTADHGDLCGEHARFNKGVPYETSAKVPFVLYFPGVVPAGTIVRPALGCVDFLPTILRLMGVEPDCPYEGRDASALFAGKRPAGWRDVAFFRGTSRNSATWLAAATARYKLVLAPNDPPWLFDLEEDPWELKNFLDVPSHREVVRSLGKALVAYCKAHRDPCGEHPRIRADLLWCAEGKGDYKPPAGGTPAGPPQRKRRRAGKKAN